MKLHTVRNFFLIFYVGTLFCLGIFLFLFAEMINVDDTEAYTVAKIVGPAFIGQITIMYQWFVDPPADGKPVRMSPLFVLLPPLCVLLGAVIVICWLSTTYAHEHVYNAAEKFTIMVTGGVGLLSVSSGVIVARVFRTREHV